MKKILGFSCKYLFKVTNKNATVTFMDAVLASLLLTLGKYLLTGICKICSELTIMVLFSIRVLLDYSIRIIITQPAITCSKLTIETLEQSVKYVQS